MPFTIRSVGNVGWKKPIVLTPIFYLVDLLLLHHTRTALVMFREWMISCLILHLQCSSASKCFNYTPPYQGAIYTCIYSILWALSRVMLCLLMDPENSFKLEVVG